MCPIRSTETCTHHCLCITKLYLTRLNLTVPKENIMSAKTIIAAVLALSASSVAFAEAQYPVDQAFVSHTTRAEVKADLARAQQQGLANQPDSVFPVISNGPAKSEVQTAGRAAASTYAGA